ncbi:MAG: phosphoribosylformylglycinamidine synthase subunit PurS, partial [Pseudomonadota bacterium]|nr:phosphoribosylformylglycinamidine synthase subunit PurS [Pseudomonadota bacterium]
MAHRIEIGFRKGIRDALGEKIKRRINEHLHIPVTAVRTVEVYTLDGDFTRDELERAAAGPLTDAVIQRYAIDGAVAADAEVAAGDFDWLIEVGFRPGVTDNVGKTAREAIAILLGIPGGGATTDGAATADRGSANEVPDGAAGEGTTTYGAATADKMNGGSAREGAATYGAATADRGSANEATDGAADSPNGKDAPPSTTGGASTARKDKPVSPGAASSVSGVASGATSTFSAAPRIFQVHTSRQYLLRGTIDRPAAERIASQLLANDLIERYEVIARADWDPVRGLVPHVPRVAGAERPATELIDLDVSEDSLLAISNERVLALTLEEMRVLRDYFRDPAVQAERA